MQDNNIRSVTLYELDYSKWVSEILSYSEECFTSGMKVFALKWPEMLRSLKRQGQTDTHGFTRVSYAYIAKCMGIHYDTAKRLILQMYKAGYIDKETKQINGNHRDVLILVLSPVWNCHFDPLPTRNKGKGQRKYFCKGCGSKDVIIEPVKIKVTCMECGEVKYYNNKKQEVTRHYE